MFNGSPNNLEELKAHADRSLKTMKDWYSENVLKMNPNKAQCILFAAPNSNTRTETFRLIIDGIVNHIYDKEKNLWVMFGSRLSFEHHIKSLCSG